MAIIIIQIFYGLEKNGIYMDLFCWIDGDRSQIKTRQRKNYKLANLPAIHETQQKRVDEGVWIIFLLENVFCRATNIRINGKI